MNDQELRAACKMAGLKEARQLPSPYEPGGFVAWVSLDAPEYLYFPNDPALPAYVAELLMRKAQEQGLSVCIGFDGQGLWDVEINDEGSPTPGIFSRGLDFSETIVRAAMAVLKERDNSK